MVYILLGNGFEEMEAVTPCDLLRRAGIPTATVGVNGPEIRGSHGITVKADMTLGQMDLTELEAVFLPGGRGGVESLLASPEALEAVRFAWENGKLVSAICAAPTILAKLGITDGKNVTCYPENIWTDQMNKANLVPGAAAVRDGNVLTGTSAGCAVPFGLELVRALAGDEAAERVAKGIVIR